MLSRYLGASLSTTRYHLVNLEKDGEIFCRKEGEYLRSYPLWARDERSRAVCAAVQQKAVRRVLRVMFGQRNGEQVIASNSWISGAAHLSQSTVSECIALLRSLHLVKRVITREGHVVFKISEGDRELLSKILASYDGNFISRATDSYLNLWEF
jgi:predicted transcriptional regulator